MEKCDYLIPIKRLNPKLERPYALETKTKATDQFAISYWTTKLLYEKALWSLLREEHFGDRESDFSSLPVCAAFAEEINELTRRFNKEKDAEPRHCGNDVLLDSEESLPDNLAARYDFLSNEIAKPAKKIPDSITKAYRAVMKEAKTTPFYSETFRYNLEIFARTFGLNEDEVNILAFLILIKVDERLRTTLNFFNYSRQGRSLVAEIISFCLSIPLPFVIKTISVDGTFKRMGFLQNHEFRSSPTRDIEDGYELFDDTNLTFYVWNPITQDVLLEKYLVTAKEPTIELTDYSHLPTVKETVLPFLKEVLKKHQNGVNILLYGPPGTGKTELSRVLAKEIGASLYEIRLCKEDDGETTWSTWSLCNNLLSHNEKTILAVDEADDLFNQGMIPFTNCRKNKGRINKSLEENPCPTIWMTNSIRSLDDAMLRRFSFILKVEAPSEKQRYAIAKRYLKDYLSETMLQRIASTKEISPALMQSVAQTAQTMAEANLPQTEEQLTTMIEEILQAQYGKTLSSQTLESPYYDERLTNCETDLTQLVEGIRTAQSARLCLYGPAGTGKTAFAHHLAKALNKPIVVKKASDLLSKWVGESEKNIANAFREARRDKAILVLDEADSFLRDRTLSSHSWEVTQVNELLTQMESFEGIFVATTNLVDNLDKASLRRFDLKAKFDYLREEQTEELFKSYAKDILNNAPLSEDIRKRLSALSNLTPGDFAAVNRQMRFSPDKTPQAFIASLEKECDIKRGDWEKRPAIGFC